MDVEQKVLNETELLRPILKTKNNGIDFFSNGKSFYKHQTHRYSHHNLKGF